MGQYFRRVNKIEWLIQYFQGDLQITFIGKCINDMIAVCTGVSSIYCTSTPSDLDSLPDISPPPDIAFYLIMAPVSLLVNNTQFIKWTDKQ